MMRVGDTVILTRCAVMIGLMLIAACDKKGAEYAHGPTVAKPAAQLKKNSAKSVIGDKRAVLDKTVWANELLAQTHEAVFVDLWDQLRDNPKADEILGNFQVEQINLCQPKAVSENINETQDCTLTDQANWRASLAAWSLAGFKLIQSEWHHRRFKPQDGQKGAESTVTIALHVLDSKKNKKLIIKGPLSIKWALRTEMDAVPQVAFIDTRALTRLTSGDTGQFKREIAHSSRTEPVLPVIVFDMNEDGMTDIVIPGQNSLYLNTGQAFDRQTLFDNPPPQSQSPLQVHSAVVADLDGDGKLDMLVLRQDALPLLYTGAEDGRFKRPGTSIRLSKGPLKEPSATALGDIDGDGDLDILITQYKEPFVEGQFPTPYFDSNDGHPRTLLENMGDGRFVDITKRSGLDHLGRRRTYGASFIDLDGDSDLDLFVTSDFAGVDIFINDGQGQFTERNQQWLASRHTFGMSHTFSDYNSDGRLDAYVTGMASTTARRLTDLGLGRDEFEKHQQMRPLMGYGNRMYNASKSALTVAPNNKDIARSGWSWGTTSLDYDNDGYPEIYIANGHLSGKTATDYCTEFWRHDIYESGAEDNPGLGEYYASRFAKKRDSGISWNGFEHNHFFVNLGNGRFQNRAFLLGLATEDDSRSALSADFDGDGRMDILVSVSPTQKARSYRLLLFKNDVQSNGHWLGLRPKPGTRSFIGATITIKAGGRQTVRHGVTGDSFMAQHPQNIHIGLGKETTVDQVTVRWPDGKIAKLGPLKADRQYIVEPVSLKSP